MIVCRECLQIVGRSESRPIIETIKSKGICSCQSTFEEHLNISHKCSKARLHLKFSTHKITKFSTHEIIKIYKNLREIFRFFI